MLIGRTVSEITFLIHFQKRFVICKCRCDHSVCVAILYKIACELCQQDEQFRRYHFLSIFRKQIVIQRCRCVTIVFELRFFTRWRANYVNRKSSFGNTVFSESSEMRWGWDLGNYWRQKTIAVLGYSLTVASKNCTWIIFSKHNIEYTKYCQDTKDVNDQKVDYAPACSPF